MEVAGHWFGNDRLDFRPEKYWKAGTKVTVDLNLDGVEGRDGVYGKQDKTVTFTIGRSQVSVVDAKTHTMKVTRDGKALKTIPVTTGAPGYETWNGQMVMTEKLAVTRMNGETVGYGGEYDIKDVPHAIRLTDSGTFIHGNYWGGGAFGNPNASHGCVGLRDVKRRLGQGHPGRVVLQPLDDRRRGGGEELRRRDGRPGQRPQRLEHVLGGLEEPESARQSERVRPRCPPRM